MKTIFISIIFLFLDYNANTHAMNKEVNVNAGAFSEASITIIAPAKEVYNAIADVNNWPEWQSSVSKAEILGEVKPGTKFIWKAGGTNIKSELHTTIPGEAIGWTGKAGWFKAVHNWYLKEVDGLTEVTVKESLSGFGASFMEKSLKKGMKQNLAELKSYLEKGR